MESDKNGTGTIFRDKIQTAKKKKKPNIKFYMIIEQKRETISHE